MPFPFTTNSKKGMSDLPTIHSDLKDSSKHEFSSRRPPVIHKSDPNISQFRSQCPSKTGAAIGAGHDAAKKISSSGSGNAQHGENVQSFLHCAVPGRPIHYETQKLTTLNHCSATGAEINERSCCAAIGAGHNAVKNTSSSGSGNAQRYKNVESLMLEQPKYVSIIIFF